MTRDIIGERPERIPIKGLDKIVAIESDITEMMRGLREEMVRKLDEYLASMPKGFTACVHDEMDILYDDMDTFKITQQLHFLKADAECPLQGRKTQYRWPSDS